MISGPGTGAGDAEPSSADVDAFAGKPVHR
jgi:hypothetical protein